MGVENSGKLGDLVTIILSHHTVRGPWSVPGHPAGPWCVHARKAGKFTHLGSYTHLDVSRVEDGQALRLVTLTLHCERALWCEHALWQPMDAEGQLVAHSGHRQQAHPAEWSPGRFRGAEVE